MNYTEKIITNKNICQDVLCYWEITGNVPANGVNSRHLPKGQNLLVFNFGDNVDQIDPNGHIVVKEKYIIVPAINSSMIINQKGRIELFGVSFIGEGIYKLLQCPVISVNYNLPSEITTKINELSKKLENKKFMERAKITDLFLENSINHRLSSNKFKKAIELIETTSGTIRVNSIANELKVSERQIQRLFKTRIGLTPKEYCKIFRFNSYLDYLLKDNKSKDLMDLVFENGYFDQPHLINEVKFISKLSPKKLQELRDTLFHRFTL